jgi:hypothetical protein
MPIMELGLIDSIYTLIKSINRYVNKEKEYTAELLNGWCTRKNSKYISIRSEPSILKRDLNSKVYQEY